MSERAFKGRHLPSAVRVPSGKTKTDRGRFRSDSSAIFMLLISAALFLRSILLVDTQFVCVCVCVRVCVLVFVCVCVERERCGAYG